MTRTVAGMLEQPVGHLLQHQPHVLEADLLAHDVERHRREAVVHGAHGAREHRAVAHSGVEQAKRGRARVDIGELHPDALGDHPFLAAGGDEQQVFLAVVVEAEVVRRPGGGLRNCEDKADGRAVDRGSGSRPIKARTRSTVSVVTRPPMRSRLTSLPSFTASRPKVDSAMRARRQNSAISCRSVSLNGHTSQVFCLAASEIRQRARVNHNRAHRQSGQGSGRGVGSSHEAGCEGPSAAGVAARPEVAEQKAGRSARGLRRRDRHAHCVGSLGPGRHGGAQCIFGAQLPARLGDDLPAARRPNHP